MTLRARMATIAATAVAIAVVAAALTAWLLTRSALLAEVDRQLREQPPQITVSGSVCISDECEVGGLDSGGPPLERQLEVAESSVVFTQAAVPLTSQWVDREGTVTGVIPEDAHQIPLTGAAQDVVGDLGADPVFDTYEADGVTFRSITLPTPEGALTYSRPLDDVTDTLNQLTLLLGVGAIAGVGLAGGAGWWVARAGLRPVDRLTRTAEQVAESKDLTHRIPVHGRDEIARLGDSINTMLEELDSARSQQRQLVEDAGHELRTPLATLRTDLGLLLRAEKHPDRSLDPAERTALIANLESEVGALSDLVTEVVELARGDADDEPVRAVDVRQIADQAVDRTRRVNPDVAVSASGPSVTAEVRPAAIERAISNLVRNALQVTPAGRTVEVKVADAGTTAVIHVLDEGAGISAEDLPRIFDRFYRGHEARERQGSGLGLAIVQQAVDQHEGSVEATNRPGIGARITVRLPVISADS